MLSTLPKSCFNVECNYNSLRDTRELKDLVYFRFDDGEKFVFIICIWDTTLNIECLNILIPSDLTLTS